MRYFVIVALALGSAQAATLTLPLTRRSVPGVRTERSTSTIPLGGGENSYFATLQVGTPPVAFLALLDTGSSDLVLETAVQSDSCTRCTTTGALYNPTKSSTANATTVPVELTYGIGSDSGVLVSDVVSFGGFSATQAFAACDVNDQFALIGESTALLGLGWASIAQTNSTPFVQNLWLSGQLDEPLFALAFGSNSAGNQLEGSGYLTLGGTNSSLYTGSLQYVDAVNGGAEGYWQFPISDVIINGASLGVRQPAAVLDSGTNSLTLPTDVVIKIYSQITGAYNDTTYGGFVYPCATNVTISFVINGASFSVRPSNFNNGVIATGSRFCGGAVVDGGASGLWIIGSTFMMSYYSVFRFDPASIGLAPIADPGNTLENAPVSGARAATGTAVSSTPTGVTSGSPQSREMGAIAILVSMGGMLWAGLLG